MDFFSQYIIAIRMNEITVDFFFSTVQYNFYIDCLNSLGED
jgi:hypothetical protein